MDKTLILDLSSDDEVGFDNSSTADNFDWISKFLEDVGGEIDENSVCNGGLFNLGNVGRGGDTKDDDDSDDVVVVGEVIAPKLKRTKTLVTKNDGDGDGDDDDCVVLDGDPDKPKDEFKDLEEDSDDLLIVGEKGQVACRDYPHPRHLCAKFPFSSTPHEDHCEMCHCYVCDSLAPCPLWSSGIPSIDHCHATDKEECWKLERKRSRQLKNPISPMPITKPNSGSLPPCHHRPPQLSTGPKQFSRPTLTSGVSSPFGLPNIIRSQRSSIAVASTRFQPHLISRQHLRSCNGNTQVQGNRGASLAPRLISSRPMFKKSGSSISRPVVSNRPSYHALNNVSVTCLQLPDQQFSGNLTENNSKNSTVSSLQLNLNGSICPPNSSCISPGALPSQLQPCPHSPTSQLHGYGHSVAVASNSPYEYASMNQAEHVPGSVLPCYTNIQNSVTLCGEQQSGVTPTISGPNFSSSIPNVLSSITQKGHQTSAAIFSFSTCNDLNGVSRSCQQSSAADNSLVQGGGVPMHELLPSIEQNAQPEQLDFDFENWLQDSEPNICLQDPPFFFDINNQASVPVPVDTGLFDEREMWVPAYMRHLFWAGMKTTQRSESIHSFFDGYVNKTTRLCEFPQQYSYAMEVRANEEKEADANCWKYTRTLLTAFPFEAQFRDVYTDAKFKEVQVQCSRVLYVTPLEKRVVGDNVVEHLLEDIVYTRTKKKREEIATMKRRTYCVWFDTASHDSGCECKHFECYGIMCRHLIKVYYMYNVEHVPSKFILRRWRKDIQRKHMVVKVAYHDLSKTAQVQRFDKLMVEFERVSLKASLLDVNIDTCMELIQLMDLRVEENNTKFYESARAGHPSSVTPESTSNGAAVTYASANRSFNYEVVPGRRPNPDQSTPCQGSTMRTQNETESTSKGTTSHSVGDPVLWRKKKGSKGGVRLQSAAEKAISKKKKKSSTRNEQAEVNQTGLPMFGVGYRPGVVAQRLFADDPPLVQPLRQLCPTEPLFGCQVTNGNHQWFPPHPHNDGHYPSQPERVLPNSNILSTETVQQVSHPHTGFGSQVPWRGGSNEQQVSHPHNGL